MDASPVSAFISYSRRESAFVDRLQTALTARGASVSVDRSDIEKGEAWWARVEQLIREADAVVFVLSPAFLASRTCRRELEFAVSIGKRLLPIVAETVEEDAVPPALSQLNYVHFASDPATDDQRGFDSAADDLARTLRTNLAWVREHTRLGVLAARWEAHGRSRDHGLRGRDLSRAEVWLSDPHQADLQATPLHAAFITASRRAAQARRRVAVGIAAGALAVTCGLGAAAMFQWREASRNSQAAQANEARAVAENTIVVARQLGSQADDLLENGLGAMHSVGVLLGVQSMRLYPNQEATSALQRAVSQRASIDVEVPACEFCVVGYYSAFSPDSARLAIAGAPSRIVDVRTGETALTLGAADDDDASPATAIAYDPVGEFVATAAGGRDITLWSAETGARVAKVPTPGEIDPPIAFSGDGEFLAVAGAGGDVHILGVPDLEETAFLPGPTSDGLSTSSSLAMNQDGTRLAQTVENDGAVYIWPLDSEDPPLIISFPDAKADFVAFSASGGQLAVGVAGGIRLLDPETGRELARLGESEPRDMVSVGYGGHDSLVGAIGWDGPAKVWDIESRQLAHTLEHERQTSGPGRIESLSLSPDGQIFATHGEVLRIWRSNRPDIAGAAIRHAPADSVLMNLPNTIPAPAGETGVSRSDDGQICIGWTGAAARVTECANSAERFAFATARPIRTASLSQTGQFAALVEDDGATTILDAGGRVLNRLSDKPDIEMAAIDENARIVALASSGGGVALARLNPSDNVRALADVEPARWVRFSADGSRLLASQDGASIRVSDVATGRTLAHLAHDRPISSALWLDDRGRYLATASTHEGAARVWDVESGALILLWRYGANLAWVDLAASGDRRYLMFSGAEHQHAASAPSRTTTRNELWRPDDLIAAACLTVNRDLSDDEWRRYMPQTTPRRPSCPERGDPG
jgi:WD40 repeat protein